MYTHVTSGLYKRHHGQHHHQSATFTTVQTPNPFLLFKSDNASLRREELRQAWSILLAGERARHTNASAAAWKVRSKQIYEDKVGVTPAVAARDPNRRVLPRK